MYLNKKKLQKIKSDASFRNFFRKKNKKKNSIIVYAKKEKEKNLLIYDSINKLLIKNDILAPKLYAENYKKNYIEIEDFGNETLFRILSKKKKNIIKLYKQGISLLIKIQKIKNKKTKNFKKEIYKIPIYSKKILFEETKLFCDWYVPKVLPKNKVLFLNKKLISEIRLLLSKIKLKNNTFVHRDFHVSNLMKVKKNIAIIDSQDALYGNMAYDLASLVDDVRIKTPDKFKEKIFLEFIKCKKKVELEKLKNDFEILSVLRNLKIIGIFTRLSIRDKKHSYLKLIPHAWRLIEYRIKKNYKFKKLKFVMEKYFSKKIRKLK
jgi:N-acetylmuramate 1-kinase|tara:strand:+ start:323 stop:1285 length:963 start_codon:yes stop_codon:yes gene_type:complete